MNDPITPAGDLPPDLHRLTINIESANASGGLERLDSLTLYGTRGDLAMLQATMETLVEALNEAAERAQERDTLED